MLVAVLTPVPAAVRGEGQQGRAGVPVGLGRGCGGLSRPLAISLWVPPSSSGGRQVGCS